MENNRYKYIHDDNCITVRTFDTEKSAFKFLDEYICELTAQGRNSEIPQRNWECMRFKDFQEEIQNNGAIVQN